MTYDLAHWAIVTNTVTNTENLAIWSVDKIAHLSIHSICSKWNGSRTLEAPFSWRIRASGVFGFVFDDHKSYLVPPSIQTPPFFGYLKICSINLFRCPEKEQLMTLQSSERFYSLFTPCRNRDRWHCKPEIAIHNIGIYWGCSVNRESMYRLGVAIFLVQISKVAVHSTWL